jgi:putative ABC transport system substrate-binding protein
MRRRDFITLAGGAVTVPLGARAQQNERIKRVGVLQPFAKDGPESARITAFLSELQGLGWTDGRNLEVEYRWQPRDFREAARELVAFSADVILVSTTPAVSAAQQTTRTIPVVFTRRLRIQ